MSINWASLLTLADKWKPLIEVFAILFGSFALVKWLLERNDRATDVLLKLEEEFAAKCGKDARQMIDYDKPYKDVAPSLISAAKIAEAGRKDREEDMADQKCIDDLLRFYLVVYAVRQARQVPDAPLSTCYRYWLAHYYHNDRKAFRQYINALYPTLQRWLLADLSWWGRFRDRPFSPWWRSFFRPCDFWAPNKIQRDRAQLVSHS